MVTHKTAPATMIAVRRERAGARASSRLNHSMEPNGSIAGSTWLALIALMSLGDIRLSFGKGRGGTPNSDPDHARVHLAGGPLIIATADAPMRERFWSGFSTSIRTGQRSAAAPHLLTS